MLTEAQPSVPHAAGDDYWALFMSLRARLNDIFAYRQSLGENCNKLQFEAFAFKFRMFIEEFSMLLRAALVERGQLSKKLFNSYGPKSILSNDKQIIAKLRFISPQKFSEKNYPNGEIEIQFEYEGFHSFSVDELEELYGQLGNYAHPTLKVDQESEAIKLMENCFTFYKKNQAIFRRHALESCVQNVALAPTDLNDFLFVVGTMDDGQNLMWRCEKGRWNRRLPN